jgi:hypothetical protein
MTKQGEPIGEITEATEVHDLASETGATSTDPAWTQDTSGELKEPSPSAPSLPAPAEPAGRTVPFPTALLAHLNGLLDRIPSRLRGPLALGATALLGVLLGALLFHGSGGGAAANPDAELIRFSKRVTAPEGELARRSLEKSDELSALAAFRNAAAYEHLRADPMAQALRARLSLVTKDPNDALDWLEQALAIDPKLGDEPWAADAVVQTFGANKPARTGALLARLQKPAQLKALREGCSDWQYRVRHGAADALKPLNEVCPDPIGFLIADAWQLDKCDQARAVVQKLTSGAQDERIPPVLDVLARRPGVGPCISDLLPKTAGK